MAQGVLKNYYLPTPKRIRKIGDSILLASVALQPMTQTLPLTDNQRLWVNFGLGCVGILGKFVTNFFTDEPAE